MQKIVVTFSIALLAACCATTTFALNNQTSWKQPRKRSSSSSSFSLSSFPDSQDRNVLLKDFGTLYNVWRDDSSLGSDSHKHAGALRIFYEKGSYSQVHHNRGFQFFSKPVSYSDAMILQYDVYFENFGWANGGKLPGLFGGVSGDGAYQCSGGDNPSTCFSLRMMWRSGGQMEVYAYIPQGAQEKGFCSRKSDNIICHSDSGQSLGRGKVNLKAGVWQTITEEVHLNEKHETNGWVKFCNQVRGEDKHCYTVDHLSMRTETYGMHIRGLFFSTFFGGKNSATDRAPDDCYTYYKNFKIQHVTHNPTYNLG